MADPGEWLLARISEDEEAYWMSMQTAGDFTGKTGPVDPGRLLRDCEAKRRVANLHRAIGPTGSCLTCDSAFPWPCPTLTALSVAYDWHDEYDALWRA